MLIRQEPQHLQQLITPWFQRYIALHLMQRATQRPELLPTQPVLQHQEIRQFPRWLVPHIHRAHQTPLAEQLHLIRALVELLSSILLMQTAQRKRALALFSAGDVVERRQ